LSDNNTGNSASESESEVDAEEIGDNYENLRNSVKKKKKLHPPQISYEVIQD
jgi:hypothetical protein